MASTGNEILALPYIDIQHDTLAVLDDVEQGVVPHENVWVSGYKAGSTSVHGKVRIEPREGGGGVQLQAREGVKAEQVSKTHFNVSIPSLGIPPTSVRFPRQVIHPPYKRPKATTPPLHINSIAHSPQKQLLAVGGPDGYLCILPAGLEGKGEPVLCKGHVGDVLDVKFFPSGEVVLSASSDLSVRVWGLDGSNPRTLKGHTRAVTCTAIIGVGKEVLTGSKDGTVRLWNVGQGKEVRKWTTSEPRCAVEEVLLVDDGGAVLACRQDGVIQVFPLDQEDEVARLHHPDGVKGSLTCAAWDQGRGLLAVGYSDGVLHLRQLDLAEGQITVRQEARIRRNEAPIFSLAWTPDGDLLVGTASGLPCRLSVHSGEEGIRMDVKEELAGWEAVAVETWAVSPHPASAAPGGGGVWCAGGEGGIRRY